MRESVGEVRGDVASAVAALLRAWGAVDAVARLELRTVAPGLVPALDRFHAAEARLLAAEQEREQAVVHLSSTRRAWPIAAVHEGMA